MFIIFTLSGVLLNFYLFYVCLEERKRKKTDEDYFMDYMSEFDVDEEVVQTVLDDLKTSGDLKEILKRIKNASKHLEGNKRVR